MCQLLRLAYVHHRRLAMVPYVEVLPHILTVLQTYPPWTVPVEGGCICRLEGTRRLKRLAGERHVPYVTARLLPCSLVQAYSRRESRSPVVINSMWLDDTVYWRVWTATIEERCDRCRP